MGLPVYLGLVNFSEDRFRDSFWVALHFLESTRQLFSKMCNSLRCLSNAKAVLCESAAACTLCFVLLYPHLFILRHSHNFPLSEVDGVSLTYLGISVCSDHLSQTFSRKARHLDCPPFWRRHIWGERQSFRTFLHDSTVLGKDTYGVGQFSPSVLTGSGGAGWMWLSLTSFPACPPGRSPIY